MSEPRVTSLPWMLRFERYIDEVFATPQDRMGAYQRVYGEVVFENKKPTCACSTRRRPRRSLAS